MNKPRVERREVHGWIALDKAVGETSTDAVAVIVGTELSPRLLAGASTSIGRDVASWWTLYISRT